MAWHCNTAQDNTKQQNNTTQHITLRQTTLQKHLHYISVAAHYITMHCNTKNALHWGASTLTIKIYMWVTITHMHGAWPKFFHAHSSGSKMLLSEKLSRTPCLSFAGSMRGNNGWWRPSNYLPNDHSGLHDSLVNMQLASQNPFSGQTVVYWAYVWLRV